MKWPNVKTGENILANKDLYSFFNGDSSYNASYSFRGTGHFIMYTCAGVHGSNSMHGWSRQTEPAEVLRMGGRKVI